jgi:hypothetical protein
VTNNTSAGLGSRKTLAFSRVPAELTGTFGSCNQLPDQANHAGARRLSMLKFPKRAIVLWSIASLVVVGGCSAKPACDSFETRNAVLQTISDDHNNPLVKYAAQNPNTAKSGDASTRADQSKERPLYVLGEKIVTISTSEDKRTLKCSGAISVTVGDTRASKEVNFTVQQSPDGKLSVAVAPFQF